MKYALTLALALVLSPLALGQCRTFNYTPYREVVERVQVIEPVAVAVPVVTVVAAYGAAYVPPPAFGMAQGGPQPAQEALTCEQRLSSLLARLDALEQGRTAPQTGAPPVAQPLPAGPKQTPTYPTNVVIPPSLFTRTCIKCHSGPKAEKGLILDGIAAVSCEKRLEVLRRINLRPDDPEAMPPAKAKATPVTDAEAVEVLEWATTVQQAKK